MIPAVAVYATAAALVTLIVVRWARFDGAGVILAFACGVIIGLAWPAAGIIYLWNEVP